MFVCKCDCVHIILYINYNMVCIQVHTTDKNLIDEWYRFQYVRAMWTIIESKKKKKIGRLYLSKIYLLILFYFWL